MNNGIDKINSPAHSAPSTKKPGSAVASDKASPVQTGGQAAEVVAVSNAIDSHQAAENALQRLKNQLASQPSAALAAFQRITGQATDIHLGSAVSTSS